MKKIKITNEGVISNGNSMLKTLLYVVYYIIFFEIKKHKIFFISISLVLFLIYCIVESFSTLNELERIFSVAIIVFLVSFWFFIKWLMNKKPKEGRRVR